MERVLDLLNFNLIMYEEDYLAIGKTVSSSVSASNGARVNLAVSAYPR
jgi:hypothetical protein